VLPRLQTTVFNVQISGNVRFEIRKVSGGAYRINIDDFSLEAYENVATREHGIRQSRQCYDPRYQPYKLFEG
jgi:hypothetical protein